MVANRKTYRKLLAAEIGAALTTANLVQAVYSYRVSNFAGKSPAVVFSSAGSDRRQEITGEPDAETALIFNVDVFTLYADKSSGWNEEDAEDRIDDIEQVIANWVQVNSNGLGRTELGQTSWFELVFNERSATGSYLQPERIGGQEYRRERMNITVFIRSGASK
jgi:hypothetical protein